MDFANLPTTSVTFGEHKLVLYPFTQRIETEAKRQVGTKSNISLQSISTVTVDEIGIRQARLLVKEWIPRGRQEPAKEPELYDALWDHRKFQEAIVTKSKEFAEQIDREWAGDLSD